MNVTDLDAKKKTKKPELKRVWIMSKPKNFDSEHLEAFAKLIVSQFQVYKFKFEFDENEKIVFTVGRKDQKPLGIQVFKVRRHWLALIQGWRVRDKDFK